MILIYFPWLSFLLLVNEFIHYFIKRKEKEINVISFILLSLSQQLAKLFALFISDLNLWKKDFIQGPAPVSDHQPIIHR